ncbi:MAG: flagellar protein FliS [Sphingomonadales bacterium]|jgi:flagellin-specific chaperone FliS|nr:flagellar protein FliS [Sphingomonadales bacterium]MBK9267502.1 flagellar protein FliS [Sphingomonadales bacterium]
MPDVNYSQASAHYRALALTGQTERANLHALVAMLYDELLLCIDVLAVRAKRETGLIDDAQAHRARGIIIALRAGLNFESGSDLAFILDGLYAALATELEEKLASPDPVRFTELRAGVESIASAWRAIAES